MPGHKGVPYLGCERLDITEIVGADSLYEADGIIAESEKNASKLFGCRTFYSTEGSSHAIRAMLCLVRQYAQKVNEKALVWATRNAHGSFITALALLDISVEWLYSREGSYLSCPIEAELLDEKLRSTSVKPIAVYITTPDYLGNQMDVLGLSEVCHKHGVLLLVDNAHGAYLKFLEPSLHPMDRGADICCDSAHKTLAVLTGGAYLHISNNTSLFSDVEVKEALRLFGSTSPSYLILQSLDLANKMLSEQYPQKLNAFLPCVTAMKERLTKHGYTLVGTEPLKLTVCASQYGYDGREMAKILLDDGITVEFSDPDYVVFMLTPCLNESEVERLTERLEALPLRLKLERELPVVSCSKAVINVREAMLAPFERLPIEQCADRILARTSVCCPPAVPILVCGELIDESAIESFKYYGIESCNVVKK